MVKEVNRLEELGKIIRDGKPAEVLYDLGKGRERTELLVTYIDGDSRVTDRIASSPQVRIYEEDGRPLMDISDSDKDADSYSYKNLRPRGAVFEPPTHPPYELGDLVIDLGENNRKLAISQYSREK